MDPFSIVSGIVGIAGFVDTIVTKSYKYITAVKGADKSIASFLDEATSFLGVLNSIQTTLKLMSEDGHLIDCESQVDNCLKLVKEIRDALVESEVRKSSFNKLKRQLKWPFTVEKTEQLVRSLERQKQTLSLTFSTKSWLVTSESGKSQAADLKTLKNLVADKYLSEEHRKIFKWLGNVNYSKLQENGVQLRSNLIRQTGSWFLEGLHFKHWMDTRGARLWVKGIPGSGKTVLASTIIQYIQGQLRDEDDEFGAEALAYFYCDFRDEKTTDPWNIIGALVRQLAQQNRQCLYDLEEFYRQYDPAGLLPKLCNPEDLAILLKRQAQKFDGDVMIVIDGLDEIENDLAGTVELLQSLGSDFRLDTDSSVLPQIQTDSPVRTGSPGAESDDSTRLEETINGTSSLLEPGSSPQRDRFHIPIRRLSETNTAVSETASVNEDSTPIKLLFISRDKYDIERQLQNFETQEIEARKDDLILYVSSEIQYRINKGTLRFQDRSLKEEVQDKLVEKAHGMFRWVFCQIEHLCKLTSDREKRNALEKLPRDLPQTYERILRAVDEDHINLVHKTLQWIIYASEPIHIDALLEALAVSPGDVDFDEDGKVEEEVLLDCCSSLVKKSQSVQGALELAHFSVKQYLLGIGLKSSPEIRQYQIKEDSSQLLLAQTCLTYLNFQSFEKGPAKTLADFNEIIEKRPFIRHASIWWDTYAQRHFRSELISTLIQSLFNPNITGQFRFWNQCLMILEGEEEFDLQSSLYRASMEASPLHWAALLALPEITRALIREFSPSKDSRLGTPVHCVLLGKFLLQKGPPPPRKPRETDNNGRNAPSAILGKDSIKTIVEHKSWRPAARVQTLRILISSDASSSYQSTAFMGIDVLIIALDVTDSNADFVSPLLEEGAKVTPKTITYAEDLIEETLKGDNRSQAGLLALIKSTSDRNLAYSDRDSFKKMTACLRNAQEEAAEILSDSVTWAETMTGTEKKQVVQDLKSTVRFGLTSKVNLFLEKLRKSRLTEEFSVQLQEAFYLAVELNWREITEDFLKTGVKVDRESFIAAVQNGNSRIVSLLVEYSSGIANSDDLFEAIYLGDYEVFSILLRAGIDTSTANEEMNLPIHIALSDDEQAGSPGRLAIIKALIELEPPLNSPNSDGQLPIHLAARLGLDDFVKTFLDRGSPADTQDKYGKCPSHYACKNDSEKTLRLLLDAGVDINAKRKGTGGSPLFYAARYNSAACARLLIEVGADLEQLSSSNFTPLIAACRALSWDVAELFIRSGADVNVMNPKSHSTVLTAASTEGVFDLVKLALSKNADLEHQTLHGETALYLAAGHGHVDVTRLLLKSGANVEANRGGYSGTPLHQAIRVGSMEIFQLLLDHGANIESPNSKLQTPLLLAIIKQEWAMTKILINKGADMNVRDKISGCTPLVGACQYDGKADIIELLLDHKAGVNERLIDNNYTALILASSLGNLANVKLLVKHGADIHAVDSTAQSMTALSHAVASNDGTSELVEYLLKEGANASDKNGDDDYSVLMMAIEGGDITIVQLLIAHGADINAQTRFNKETAISIAVSMQRADICKLLLENGADLTLVDNSGKNIAHQIAIYAKTEVMMHFLPYEVDWNMSEGAKFIDDEDNMSVGISPLHFAAQSKFVDFINILWDRGLLKTIDPPCGPNTTPLHGAAEAGNSEVVKTLLAKGANINAVTSNRKWTPLHFAASRGHSQTVSVLVTSGADVDMLDKDGHTAADLTVEPLILQNLKNASKQKGTSSKPKEHSLTVEMDTEAVSILDPLVIKLCKACEDGDIDIVRRLLSLGVDINGDPEADCCPLIIAMSQEDMSRDIVHLLIDSGANLHCHAGPLNSRHGFQPLHFAVWHKCQNTLQKLLDKKVRMADFGVDPCHIAAFHQDTTMLSILLAYECAQTGDSAQRMLNAQIRTEEKFPKKRLSQSYYATGYLASGTPLHLAAFSGSIPAVSILLEYGANVNAVDELSQTPLHHAVKRGHYKVVKKLLEEGALTSIRDFGGSSAFLSSIEFGRLDIMEELISRFADITDLDNENRGAIHYAIQQPEILFLEKLQSLGLSFDSCDNFGDTPFALGIRTGAFWNDDAEFETAKVEFILRNCSLHDTGGAKYGNLLNLAVTLPWDITFATEEILKRLSKEESTETVHSYINNISERNGSPLYFAAYAGNVKIMNVLLKAGAEVALAQGPLGSAFHAACSMGRVGAIKCLLERGAGPVDYEAIALASKYEPAVRLLNRYSELGLEGLVEDAVVVLPRINPPKDGTEEIEAASKVSKDISRTSLLMGKEEQEINNKTNSLLKAFQPELSTDNPAILLNDTKTENLTKANLDTKASLKKVRFDTETQVQDEQNLEMRTSARSLVED